MHKLLNLKLLSGIYALAFSLLIFNMLLNVGHAVAPPLNPLAHKSVVRVKTTDAWENSTKVVYGFLPYWKLDKLAFIKTELLTDIAYFGLYINSDGTIRKYSDDGTLDPGYNSYKNNKALDVFFEATKRQNKRLALTIISHEDDVSTNFLNCTSCWKTFATETTTLMKEKGITDVNLDFEYVEYVDDTMAQKYTDFTAYLNKELDNTFKDSILTVSAYADSPVKNRVTDIETLQTAADRIFIMAYDFHYRGSTYAGPVAPIEKSSSYTSYDISSMLKDYVKISDSRKLILGVPYYGYNWVTDSQQEYARRIDGSDYTGYSVSQTYESLMDLILEQKPDIKWDAKAKVPYFFYTSPDTGATRVVYYENAESLSSKYNLSKQYNMLGIGIWALGYDGGYQELWQALDTHNKL